MNRAKEWNIIDIFIMKAEDFIHNFRLEDLSDQVDTETIIAAQTEYLREENEHLKARETPIYMIEKDEKYFCPKCHTFLQENAKYCSNCGHRVIKHISVDGYICKVK
ncbi:MAG: zinc-ribbon domain-containing protein [Clostridiales bacterium]|nr:zinc-ribbon domain-containing protein [Clostridiales bacterium]